MKILVLTSGGDAPGMNMFLFELSKAFGQDLYACYGGFQGLIDGNIRQFNNFYFFCPADMKKIDFSKEAGSVIKCSRCPDFKTPKGFEKGLKNAKNFDYVIILGGNGSHKGAMELSAHGVNTIFVPATIDNDVNISEYSQGFDTAVNACLEMYRNVMPTMHAFNRCAIFEVMGRECPAIANEVYYNCDADILVAEKKELDLNQIVTIAVESKEDEHACAVIIRENIIDINKLCKKLSDLCPEVEFKGVVVGYPQRGTKPTQKELKIAKTFAKYAIKHIKSGDKGCASVVVKDDKVCLRKE